MHPQRLAAALALALGLYPMTSETLAQPPLAGASIQNARDALAGRLPALAPALRAVSHELRAFPAAS